MIILNSLVRPAFRGYVLDTELALVCRTVAVVLVGGCPDDTARCTLRCIDGLRTWGANGQVPRDLSERRAACSAELGDGEVHKRYRRSAHRLAI